MPELERLMLHRLAELDALVRQAYAEFDYKRIFAQLNAFMTSDLSAFYFDIRKDALYCDPVSSAKRKACLTVLDQIFRCTVDLARPDAVLLARKRPGCRATAPTRRPCICKPSRKFRPRGATTRWPNKWRKVRLVRRVVTGALELERAQKRIGSSLEAAPAVYVADKDLFAALVDVDLAEICITSGATLVEGEGPADAFRLDETRGVAVAPKLAAGKKCARSWKVLESVGSDPDFPDVSPRDAQALREWEAMRKAAE